MLTAGMKALYRDYFEDTFDKTCVIVRTAGTSDGMGGYGTETTFAGTVACRIGFPIGGATEGVAAGQLQAVGTHVITMPAFTDIGPSDRVTIGTRVFNVIGGTGERSHELSRRVAVNEINEGVS